MSPILKKGTTCMAVNYRPVSLTRVSFKQLEHIICSHIGAHLDQYNLLTRLQHGFRSRFSFETQLFATIQDLFSLRAKGAHVDIAVRDFSKAFEEVPHKLLMPILRMYGIQGRIHT